MRPLLELKRQAVHAAGILTIVPLLLDRTVGIAVIGSLLAFFVLWAIWHRTALYKFRALNVLDRIAAQFVSTYERPAARPLAGAVWWYTGALAAAVVFPVHIAVAAIAVLALADAASTVVGHYFGTHKLPINPSKSWEGSAVFFVTAAAVLLLFVSPLQALLTAFIAMAVEGLPRINDNVSIPLVTGAVLSALGTSNL